MEAFLDFVKELSARKIYYSLSVAREDAVMVEITVPGEKWEVEFFADGRVEVEIFKSDGEILGLEAINKLLVENSD
jgi:hypothetical protein